MSYELQPKHDTHKSFYGKAIVNPIPVLKVIELWSYHTCVAKYFTDAQEIKVLGLYSATTLRHIKEFIFQLTGESLNQAEIVKRYMTNA